jgi:metallo-beta-lactamase family protein
LERPETSLLLAGYQAEGARDRDVLEGAKELKIYGKHYQVKAEIFVIVIAFDFVVVPALFGKE